MCQTLEHADIFHLLDPGPSRDFLYSSFETLNLKCEFTWMSSILESRWS